MRQLKILLVSIAVLFTSTAIPCCGVSSNKVIFGEQANIILWDAAKNTEHFFRSAKFKTDAPDFGFIAPTPSIPEIGEADQRAISTLQSLAPYSGLPQAKSSNLINSAGSVGQVKVIQVGHAAGFEITTLKASDSAALADWLKAHDYKTSPSIEKWVQFYIDKGWYLTAFKFVADKGEVQTKIVRLSFTAEKPFNPYFVPDVNQGRRSLQDVFFVSSGVYAGNVKDFYYPASDWSARVGTSAERLKDALGLRESFINPDSIVTHFSASFPSEAKDDVYFHLDLDQQVGWTSAPRPNEYVNAAVALFLFGLLGTGILIFIKKFREA